MSPGAEELARRQYGHPLAPVRRVVAQVARHQGARTSTHGDFEELLVVRVRKGDSERHGARAVSVSPHEVDDLVHSRGQEVEFRAQKHLDEDIRVEHDAQRRLPATAFARRVRRAFLMTSCTCSSVSRSSPRSRAVLRSPTIAACARPCRRIVKTSSSESSSASRAGVFAVV